MTAENSVFNVDGMVAHTAEHNGLLESSDDKNGVVQFCETIQSFTIN